MLPLKLLMLSVISTLFILVAPELIYRAGLNQERLVLDASAGDPLSWAALKYEVFKRTKVGEVGSCEIACRCGKAITAEVKARQCAYCRGIATAPFHGYGGQVLEYKCGVEAPMM